MLREFTTMETMTGNKNYNTSIYLYHLLCQRVVAPEDHVKMIRMMNAVRDHLAHDERLEITSGSFGEGIELCGSDVDMVYVWKFIEVVENLNSVQINPTKTYFAVETNDLKPGTANLRLVYTNQTTVLEDCVPAKGSVYFSSEVFKRRFISRINPIIHGPCVSNVKGNYDGAHAVHCKSWIWSARHWIHRSSNSWPSAEIKQTIVHHGVLFVPIGHKESQNDAIEWRISFSVGERFLIYSFNHTQLLCYVLLKMLLGTISEIEPIFNDSLCSYFLKTVMFWLSEELPQTIWKPENLLSCSIRCLNRLIYCVQYSVCPHYFIPENNMFENKLSGFRQDFLLGYLNSINWQEVLDGLIFLSIDILNELHNNSNVSFIDRFERIIHSKLLTFVRRDKHNYGQAVGKILSCKSTRIKRMYLYNVSMICNDVSQSISKTSIYCCNKYKYKHCKFRMCFLLQSVHHDAITGWLMLASMYYNEKQYNKSVSILDYALSKYTPEKIPLQSTLSEMQKDILKLKVFQEKGIIRALNVLFIGFVKFYKYSNLIPTELEMEVDNVFHVIPSVVYAHFLYFLCYYHSSNVDKCIISLRKLKLTILGNVSSLGEIFKGVSYNILGIALQITGDKKSALEAFRKAVELEPNPIYHSAARRAAMLKTT